jgi:hypothetical protein
MALAQATTHCCRGLPLTLAPSPVPHPLTSTHQERRRALAGDLDKPFITVMRHAPAGSSRHAGALRPVQLPTGSVRASFGSLSTFEDAYALVGFLAGTYLE